MGSPPCPNDAEMITAGGRTAPTPPGKNYFLIRNSDQKLINVDKKLIKPPKAGRGRPKGALNKKPSKAVIRQEIREKILTIDDHLTENKMGLAACAEKDPKWFYEAFYRSLIPKGVEVSGSGGGPILVSVGHAIMERLSEIYKNH